MNDVLSFDGFCAALVAELSLAATALQPSSRLVDDLRFDSLLTFELVLVIEDLAHAMLPEELIGQLVTLDDAYHVYWTRATQH